MVYMTVHNIHFKKIHRHLNRVVEIEGFTFGSTYKEKMLAFCEHNKRAADSGEANCNKLPYDACSLSECCGWAIFKEKNKDESGGDDTEKCVAMRVRNGKPLGMIDRSAAKDVDSLYFQYKKVDI